MKEKLFAQGAEAASHRRRRSSTRWMQRRTEAVEYVIREAKITPE